MELLPCEARKITPKKKNLKKKPSLTKNSTFCTFCWCSCCCCCCCCFCWVHFYLSLPFSACHTNEALASVQLRPRLSHIHSHAKFLLVLEDLTEKCNTWAVLPFHSTFLFRSSVFASFFSSSSFFFFFWYLFICFFFFFFFKLVWTGGAT